MRPNIVSLIQENLEQLDEAVKSSYEKEITHHQKMAKYHEKLHNHHSDMVSKLFKRDDEAGVPNQINYHDSAAIHHGDMASHHDDIHFAFKELHKLAKHNAKYSKK